MEDNLPNKLALLLQNQKLVERINKVFGNFMDLPLNILFQIMDNQELFLTISQNVFRFFVSLSDAIDSKVDSDILLHLGKINLYVLMTQGQYIYVFDEPEISGIYQIILLSEKQKIILLCDQSKEFIDDLIIKIKNSTKYNINFRVDRNLEITNKIADNYNQSIEIYDEITKALRYQYKDINQIIKLIQPENIMTPKSIEKVIKLAIESSMIDWASGLGTVNVTISDNHGVVNIGNSNKTTNKTDPNKYDIICSWIKNNPPIQPIAIGKYRELCIENVNKDITNIYFGKLVKRIYPNITQIKQNGTMCYKLPKC